MAAPALLTMAGGVGNDTYYVDNTSDVIKENADEGTDKVYASADYTLSDNIENLTLTGTDSITGTGNDSDNYIIGNSGDNTLSGGAGNDTIDGAGGADSMIGGAGNDLYYVDNIGDVVTENSDEGTDEVYSSADYTLSDNIENLTLTGTDSITGTGNDSDNYIIGNLGDNTISGGAGADTIYGGSGADSMVGGEGNDLYYVDNTNDVITENTDEGTDTISSSVTYTLSNNVENLTLTGTNAVSGYGNNLDNTIIGNSATNIINGGSGADTMAGGAGNDTYYVDNSGDVVTEGSEAGSDTVYSEVDYTLTDNVENLILEGSDSLTGTGNELDNSIVGNDGDNILSGSAGADTIDGGSGADTMIGGGGNDIYYVDNTSDVITDKFGRRYG